MEKKPRFNIIDALIIVLVLVVGAVGYIMAGKLGIIGGGSNASESGAATVTYKLEFLECTKEVSTAFENAKGQSVWLGEKERAAAVLDDVRVTPAKKVITQIDTGESVWAEIPGRYDIEVTLVSKGSETGSAVYADNVAVHVGEAMVVRGKGCAGYGYITDLAVTY